MGFSHSLGGVCPLDMRHCGVELLGISLECLDADLFEVDRERVEPFKNTLLATLDRKGSLGRAILKHNTVGGPLGRVRIFHRFASLSGRLSIRNLGRA
jgi:hypothetical protein